MSLPPSAPAPSHPVTAVLFDYGQVLSRGPNPDAWQRLRSIAGGSEEQFHAAYWEPRHPYDRGDLTGTAYWHRVATLAGHPGLSPDDLEALYAADVDLWTDRNEPMIAWAQSLQQRGLRTGILSNIGDRMETGVRSRFSWIDAFHHSTWSHQLGIAKPEIEIYRHAAEGLNTPPAEVLFVDDREDNIAAAQTAGMQAIRYLFADHPAFIAEMQRRGLGYLL